MNKWKITCVVLALATISLGFYTLNNETIVREYQNEEYTRTGILSHFFQLNSKMMGTVVNDLECEAENGNVLLSEIGNNKPVLVYRYTENDCQSCIEKDLKILYKYFEESDSTLVRVLSTYHSRRQYLVEKNNIKLPLFNIPKDTLSLETERYGTSYCFVLYPNMKVSNVFIPDQQNPEYTNQYFEAVKRFLSDE